MDPGTRSHLEELQLLAEEKWLIDALKIIQRQRHSLQIERLHLQSLRSRLVIESKPGESREGAGLSQRSDDVPIMDLMQLPTRTDLEIMDRPFNDEQLNLDVTEPVYLSLASELDMEDEDDDDDLDEDDYDIDMNMFMNGVNPNNN